MDSKEGKVFDLLPEGTKVRHLHTHGHKYKPQPGGDHNEAHQHGLDGFFKQLADSIKDAKEVIVLGPSEAKVHFKSYLEKHFAHTLAKKIVAVETVDHPSDNQILAQARKFFKAYDAFQQ
ncbi:MAG: translational machinery protein [Deltaproteobacteria bacterium]|nr:translational machinery protein [Deltaproteobacteria bacterium]